MATATSKGSRDLRSKVKGTHSRHFELTEILASADLSKLPQELKDKVDNDSLSVKFQRVICAKSLSVLVTGRSGVGKSTIINGLLGMTMEDDKHAKESAAIARPGNLSLTPYTKKKGKIDVTVWDSRGLLDGTPTTEQERSLKQMVSKCSEVDLKLVCIQMNVMRFFNSEQNPDVVVLITLAKAFGKSFWNNAVIVLTFANYVAAGDPEYIGLTDEEKSTKFAERVCEWKQQVHAIIREHTDLSESETHRVKVVPAGHYKIPNLPDREYWLTYLWFECLEALGTPEAKEAMINIGTSRLMIDSEVDNTCTKGIERIEDYPLIIPSKKPHHAKQPMLEKVAIVLGCAAGGSGCGATIGLAALAAGPLGGAVGIPAGAVMGFCIWSGFRIP